MSNFNDATLPEHAQFKQCPYDKVHLVPASSFPKHLLKCRRNYKGPPLKQCRFNVSHLTLPSEIAQHEKTCIDRALVESQIENLSKRKHEPTENEETEIPQKRQNHCSSEEEEVETVGEDLATREKRQLAAKRLSNLKRTTKSERKLQHEKLLAQQKEPKDEMPESEFSDIS